MARKQVSEAEWQTSLNLADRLEVPVRELLQGQPRFTEMESAAHRLGQAVAQVATERLSLARAGQMTEPQPFYCDGIDLATRGAGRPKGSRTNGRFATSRFLCIH